MLTATTSKELGSGDRVYQNAGNEALLSLVDLRSPGRALDCGCGAGDNARRLGEKGWAVTGVTLSAEEQRIAARHCETVLIHDLDLGLPLNLGGPFRLVILSHLLEHLRNPHALLRDLRDVLTPDGIIAVALPNVLYWSQRARFLSGRFEYSDIGIMDYTHLRFYTYESGRRLLVDSGYRILRQTVEGFVPFPFRRALPRLPLGPINRLFSRAAPGLFGWQLLYVATSHAALAHSDGPEGMPRGVSGRG